jgi:DNA repair protein RadC
VLPSGEDNDITYRLKAAADVLGIHFLDHIIFSPDNFYSYRQAELAARERRRGTEGECKNPKKIL